MDVLLATNNEGKVDRFKRLIGYTGLDIKLHTPAELGIEVVDVEENAETLSGNAKLKARAYTGKADMPILANDTGFWVEGEGFVDAPKRKALGDTNETDLSKEEISQKLLEFWKGVAKKHGGEVDAAWIEAFVALYPDGSIKKSESRRDVILTDQAHGIPPLQMPVRALYYSKTTNKPSIQHTEEEEGRELKPVTDALIEVLQS